MKQDEIDQIIAEALEKEKGRNAGRWHRPSRRRQWVTQARTVLNIVFMFGFVAAILIYFLLPEQRGLYFGVGLTALLLKIAEFVLRFMF